ncbi:MAG: PAS domain S-box protein [Gemmatimonadales bacterium]|nr:MAG: PAS domain S-box protein [Gemmatimonadales bacterium]
MEPAAGHDPEPEQGERVMITPAVLAIGQNVVLLLAVAVIFDLASTERPISESPARQLLTGLVLGAVAVVMMMTSLQLGPGVFFDARSVVIGVAGLFFGGIATAAAVSVAVLFRISQGGPGALTGVLVILGSGMLGVAWRHLRAAGSAPPGFRELYLFGLCLHLLVLALFLTLPDGIAFEILPQVALPVLALFPVATAALGLLLVRKVRRDTTAKRLEESESRYRSLFEDGSQAMLVIDPEDGRIVDANAPAAAFYGYPRASLKGMKLTTLDTRPAPEVMGSVKAARAGHQKRFELSHRLANGSMRAVEVHGAPITIEGRTLLHSIIHDVSERHEAQAAVQIRDEALRLKGAALEAAANPIVITDTEGTIEWVNPAFTELTGFGFDEAVGQTPGALINSGTHPAEFFGDLWSTIRDGRVWEGEVVNRKKDGSVYRENQTITPVRVADGEITHYVSIKQDLTERIELQARLTQAQKMEAVGQLAGGVAHDFNNLLTVINGTAQLALEVVERDSPGFEALVEIFDAGERAARLTRQLLTFSRRSPNQPEVLDLNRLVEETANMLQRLLPQGVELVLDLAEDSPHLVEDPTRVEQVILNLCLNARDAMPRGGTITIQTEWMPHAPGALRNGGSPGRSNGDARPSKGFSALRVIDTGEGMSPEIQERIFDPFFTTKKEGEGTGLGLATVYEIVRQADGEISVESEVGEGTAFEILLPGSDARLRRPEEDMAATDRSLTGSRILIVEDDSTIRKVTRRILERAGLEVTDVGSGDEALTLLTANGYTPDLVLTDVVMPGMTGPELAQRLRSRGSPIRVLFSSGYTESALEEHGLDPAEYPFLAKPYTVEGLTEKVREVLGS